MKVPERGSVCYSERMGTAITLIGIGLMVQTVIPAPAQLVGFVVFCIGAVMMLVSR